MISLVIPSYKFHHYIMTEIQELIKFLESRNTNFEVILVDDGSEDQDTPRDFCSNLNIKFLCNSKNTGKGASIAKGVHKANGNYIIFTDVDIPYKFENILTMIDYLNEGYDLVIGDRSQIGSKYYIDSSTLRTISSKIFLFIVRNLFSSYYTDTQCGLKGFQAKSAKLLFSELQTKRFAFDIEILKRARKYQYKIKKIPVQLRKVNSQSTIFLWKHAPRMLWDTLKIMFQK